MERHWRLSPGTPPILIFGSHLDLPPARIALRAGASGFVHAEMAPEQLARAITVTQKGELVAPRELPRLLLDEEEPANLGALSAARGRIWRTWPKKLFGE